MKDFTTSKAAAYRNTLLMCLCGLEQGVKNAKNAEDYIALIERTGTLAECMAKVLAALIANKETLEPVDEKSVSWIKKL